MIEEGSLSGRRIIDSFDMKVSGGYKEVQYITPMIGMLRDRISGVRQDTKGNIYIGDTLNGKSKKRWLKEFGDC